MGSTEPTMKLATVLVLSLVILGATARRGGGHKKLLRKCGIKRDFCDQGRRPHVRPVERDCSSYVGNVLEKVAKGDKPKREECTVGDMVTKEYCVLCVEKRSKEVMTATAYEYTVKCIDDCKRADATCLDRKNAVCKEV